MTEVEKMIEERNKKNPQFKTMVAVEVEKLAEKRKKNQVVDKTVDK